MQVEITLSLCKTVEHHVYMVVSVLFHEAKAIVRCDYFTYSRTRLAEVVK